MLTREAVLSALNMQSGGPKRVVIHWTAGGPNASSIDREHYHFLVEQSGNLVRGKCGIADNDTTSDNVYAAHTLGCNTRSVGISLCGMAGATESPFVSGANPINEKQLDNLCMVVAEICRKYKIPITKTTVLTHAEVQHNLGIRQRGKWDITRFPWSSKYRGADACGAYIRSRVLAWYNGTAEFPYRDHMKRAITFKGEGRESIVMYGWLDDGETMIDIRTFVDVMKEHGVKASYLAKPNDQIFVCHGPQTATVEADETTHGTFVSLREVAKVCGIVISYQAEEKTIRMEKWG